MKVNYCGYVMNAKSFSKLYNEIVDLVNKMNQKHNKNEALFELMEYLCEHVNDLCIFFDKRLKYIIFKIAMKTIHVDKTLDDKFTCYYNRLEPFFIESHRKSEDELTKLDYSNIMCEVVYGYSLVSDKPSHYYEMERLEKYISYVLMKRWNNDIDLNNIYTYTDFNVFFDEFNT